MQSISGDANQYPDDQTHLQGNTCFHWKRSMLFCTFFYCVHMKWAAETSVQESYAVLLIY